MLEIKNLTVRYGPVLAVEDLSLSVEDGSTVAILGPNGAGKSSTLNTIAGLIKPAGGTIYWANRAISKSSPQEIARAGISLVMENRELFPEMSVAENLLLGAHIRKDRKKIVEDTERILGYFPALRECLKQQAGTMSGGQQQFLAIARALMAKPKLLLLDEPSLGLAPIIVKDIFEILRTITAEENLSVLIVEQNARAALRIASQVYIFEAGRLVSSGSTDDISSDEVIRQSYLGI
jgi:branched-chain amino acid transport system ATP-binding protein